MPQRKTYLVHLVVDETVLDCGSTQNCRHALHGAYQAVMGIPGAEATVRAEGELLATLSTNWKGKVCEIDWYARLRRDRPYRELVIHAINPDWKGWPGHTDNVKGRCFVALLNRS